MKKIFKIASIITISIVFLFILYLAYSYTKYGFRKLKIKNERINKCTSLSKYVEYHDSTHLQSSFDSLSFYAKDIKFDLLNEKNIKNIYEYGNKLLIICDDNTIYEACFITDQSYSNGMNYKQIETDFSSSIKNIFYYSYDFVIQCTDGTLYRAVATEYASFKFEKIDYTNDIRYDVVINNPDIIKVFYLKSLEGNSNIYKYQFILLKNDGNIYKQIYSYEYTNNQYIVQLLSEEVLYSSQTYGKIYDAIYSSTVYLSATDTPSNSDDYTITTIVSDSGLYYLAQTSKQEYIDSTPTYEIIQSDLYKKYKNDVFYIDANFTITNDNNILKTSTLCTPIDKETK